MPNYNKSLETPTLQLDLNVQIILGSDRRKKYILMRKFKISQLNNAYSERTNYLPFQ